MDLITFALLPRPADQPDRLFGLELSEELEVVPLGPITRVPRAPAAIVGVMNLKGQVVSLVDLARAVGLGPCAPPRPGDPSLLVRVVGCRMVLCVDRILDVERGAPSHTLPEAGLTVIAKVVETGAGQVHLVDLERLMDQLSAQIALDNARFEGGSLVEEDGQ